MLIPFLIHAYMINVNILKLYELESWEKYRDKKYAVKQSFIFFYFFSFQTRNDKTSLQIA